MKHRLRLKTSQTTSVCMHAYCRYLRLDLRLYPKKGLKRKWLYLICRILVKIFSFFNATEKQIK